jgi:hypothetical protein
MAILVGVYPGRDLWVSRIILVGGTGKALTKSPPSPVTMSSRLTCESSLYSSSVRCE